MTHRKDKKTVARFEFDPATRRWKGPVGSDEDFWKTGTDPAYRVRWADLTQPPPVQN